MSLLADQYEFRRLLVERLERDLIGPTAPEETIADAPITTYISGVLFPRDAGTVAPEQDLDLDEGYDEVNTPEPTVAMANARYPSSMGLTFAVADDADTVSVAVAAARYHRLDPDEGHEDGM